MAFPCVEHQGLLWLRPQPGSLEAGFSTDQLPGGCAPLMFRLRTTHSMSALRIASCNRSCHSAQASSIQGMSHLEVTSKQQPE